MKLRENTKLTGNKVYGTVPLSDKDFGINHLQLYINAKVDNRKIFDEIIDTQSWYKQDLTCCLYGDVILMIGNSLGSLGELTYAYYLYKLFRGSKPELVTVKSNIHPQIKAGDQIPFSVIPYKPFIKGKLNFEIENYIKKLGGDIYYTNTARKIKSILSSLTLDVK